MKLEATRYMRMPFFVTGHQVTEANMAAVAQWCEGNVFTSPNKSFIRVPITHAKSVKQTEAYVGDHILKTDFGGRIVFKIEKDAWIGDRFIKESEMITWFAENFIKIGGFEKDSADDLEIEDVVTPSNVRPLPSQLSRPRGIRAQR